MADCQQYPFLSPSIPFIGPLLGGLQEGKTLIIIGRVLPNADKFTVDLQHATGCGTDIALHFKPHFDDGPTHIVFNTFEKGNWGPEEKSTCPFVKGQPFTLEIHVTKEAYKVSVNGQHLADYKHRISFTLVDTILVHQMVELDFIAYQKPVTVPYKTLISDGMKSGKDIVIHGVPNADSKRIEFNLRHRFGSAFHYQCRFDENAVVRNTHENGSWGPEERDGAVPFIPGQFFQVKISCNRDHFDVFVNGEQIHTYKHRFTKLEEIDVFEVYGQLELFYVHV
ncbi:lectin, galactoside-binding, soluble, 9 (galectin 9)-like 5 isoform X1 [Danio rerio]|uniref:Lectin, galactoside-binding, soluble, 9 (Galectin 9)-like 5 isoform X1 n=8 Tax=Danio rerio TaxID=7955 RepID=A0AC58H9T1_DANRE